MSQPTAELDEVEIWTRYQWTCDACGFDVDVPLGLDAPNRGDELVCDACGATNVAGGTH